MSDILQSTLSKDNHEIDLRLTNPNRKRKLTPDNNVTDQNDKVLLDQSTPTPNLPFDLSKLLPRSTNANDRYLHNLLAYKTLLPPNLFVNPFNLNPNSNFNNDAGSFNSNIPDFQMFIKNKLFKPQPSTPAPPTLSSFSNLEGNNVFKNSASTTDDERNDHKTHQNPSESDENNSVSEEIEKEDIDEEEEYLEAAKITDNTNGDDNKGGSIDGNSQNWNFEEQFKQLYELSDEPKRKEFLDELFSFMQKRGNPVNRIPIMAKQVLDLFALYKLVISRGGLVEVINKKLWREITKGLNLPSSITSAAFTLRTQYMKYLYPFECDRLKLSTPSELQAAIDGNRREARRPTYNFEYHQALAAAASASSGNHGHNLGAGNVGPNSVVPPFLATVAASFHGNQFIHSNNQHIHHNNSGLHRYFPPHHHGSNTNANVPHNPLFSPQHHLPTPYDAASLLALAAVHHRQQSNNNNATSQQIPNNQSQAVAQQHTPNSFSGLPLPPPPPPFLNFNLLSKPSPIKLPSQPLVSNENGYLKSPNDIANMAPTTSINNNMIRNINDKQFEINRELTMKRLLVPSFNMFQTNAINNNKNNNSNTNNNDCNNNSKNNHNNNNNSCNNNNDGNDKHKPLMLTPTHSEVSSKLIGVASCDTKVNEQLNQDDKSKDNALNESNENLMNQSDLNENKSPNYTVKSISLVNGNDGNKCDMETIKHVEMFKHIPGSNMTLPENSMIVTMEISGTDYHGILFSKKENL